MTMTPTRPKPTISSGPNVLPFEPVGLAVLRGLAVVGSVFEMGTESVWLGVSWVDVGLTTIVDELLTAGDEAEGVKEECKTVGLDSLLAEEDKVAATEKQRNRSRLAQRCDIFCTLFSLHRRDRFRNVVKRHNFTMQ